MTAGLNATGFTKARIADIITALQDAVAESYGDSFIRDDKSPMGKLIGIMSEREALIWDALEAVYNGQNVDTAGGVSQDACYAITGHLRQESAASTVKAYLAGTPGTIIPAESIISVEQTGDFFKLMAQATLGTVGNKTISSITRSGTTATAETSTVHGLATDDYVFVSGADQDDYNILAQITVTDTTHFTYEVANSPATPATGSPEMDEATEAATESVEHGEIQALAGTLTVIENPVSGWDRAGNTADADLGRLDETDAEFRTRRDETLTLLAAGTLEAIRSALLNITGVSAANVFVNDTGDEDAEGRPPHSIECTCVGGAAGDIAQCIFDNKAAGIETHGTEPVEKITDSQAIDHDIYFSRLAEVEMHVELTITTNSDPNEGPVWDNVTGEQNIIDNILAYGEEINPGQDIITIPYLLAAVAAEPGIATIIIYCDRALNPAVNTPITIAKTEIAVFESGRITGTIDGVAI